MMTNNNFCKKIKFFSINDTIEFLVFFLVRIFKYFDQNRYFITSVLFTVIFYLPAIKNESVDAGLLYTGDVLGYYLPALAKTHDLLSKLSFTAIDFSLFNGSSDFFLSPNFFALHPLVVIFSLITPAEFATFKNLGKFLVFLLAFHSFLACYFSLKLFTRFFSFEFGLAAFVASGFAFSIYAVNATSQPPFLFSITIIPWVVYGALNYWEESTLRNLLLACLPILFAFMGGYIPMGVGSLALSAVLVATKVIVVDYSLLSIKEKVRGLIFAMLPFICASIIVAPYLYAVFTFNQETSGIQAVSLFYSAHQLAELPQTLLRLISFHLTVPGPSIEFSIYWGMIPIIISIAFIYSFSSNTIDILTACEWRFLKVSALIYFTTVLAIFGEFSVVSDLVYYLVPQVGKMHIYQRFLMPANLMFLVMVALMLKAVIQARPIGVLRVIIVLFAVATLTCVCLVGYNPSLSVVLGLNNYIIFELFLGFLFAFTLIMPGKSSIYIAAIVLMCVPVLDSMYDRSHGGNTFAMQKERQKIALNANEQTRLVTWIKHFSNKAIIKYVDITPMWTKEGIETFPKDFPYFILKELPLSSYGGFTFYLSARADYMRKMPVMADNAVSPDWMLIENSGADFVVARESDIKGGVSSLLLKAKGVDFYRLPNDVVIIPLQITTEKVPASDDFDFDNGYFKISPIIPEVSRLNIAKGKYVRQSSNGGGDARLAVDGNTNGDFTLGSVSHTTQDANAWFEIDLGQVESIESVEIWNRTDCCSERLHDYWIFISETPFLVSDTAKILQRRSGTWGTINLTPNPRSKIKTEGVRGRYVRLQLAGDMKESSFLSLAEVKVFRVDIPITNSALPSSSNLPNISVKNFITNNSNYLQLDLDTSVPASVQYLFWDNPRLNYYLNGNPTKLVEKNGLKGIDAPPGHNVIEIKYRHWPLNIFWLFYSMYALALFWVQIPTRFQKMFR